MVIMHQRKMQCQRLGLSSRIKSETTANLGTVMERMLGKKPTIVHRIAPDFWSVDNTAICRPSPDLTAATVKATASQPNICICAKQTLISRDVDKRTYAGNEKRTKDTRMIQSSTENFFLIQPFT